MEGGKLVNIHAMMATISLIWANSKWACLPNFLESSWKKRA